MPDHTEWSHDIGISCSQEYSEAQEANTQDLTIHGIIQAEIFKSTEVVQ